MSDDLRARIERAVGSVVRPSLECEPLPDEAAIVDAVMAVVNRRGPDDLDQFIREQAAASPEFAAATIEAQHATRIREFEDLLGCLWLYVNWRYVTKQLETVQKNLFADSVDAWTQRIADADGRSDAPSRVDRWWAK